MSLPYTLVEKSVLRKVGSPNTIGQVIVDTKSWMASLQENNDLPDFFYYAEVIDADTKLRYFVYSDEAVAYFGLVDNIVEADPTSTGESIVGSGVVSKSDVYSLDEVKTDKLYLGKPVYRRVCRVNIEDNSLIENHYYQISEILDIDNISELSSLKEVHDNNNIEIFKENYLMLFYGLVRGTQIQEWLDNGETIHGNISDGLWFKPSITHASYNNFEITVEYTKTTDSVQEPETLNIIQSEMPSYSTEEVLTTERWIDGKPIYRKSFSLIAPDVTHEWADTSIIVDSDLEAICTYDYFMNSGLKSHSFEDISKIAVRDDLHIWLLITEDWQKGQTLTYNVSYTKTTDTAESPVAQLSIPRKEIIFGSWEYTYQGDYRSCDGVFDFGETETPEMFVDGKFIVPEDGIYSSEVALWIGNTDEVQQGYLRTSRRMVNNTFKRVGADAAVNLNTLHFLSKGDVIYYQALVSVDSNFSNHNFNALSLKIEKIG